MTPHTLVVATLTVMMAAAVAAQDQHIERKDLPAAVEQTVRAHSDGATIKGFSTEVEGGRKIYEAQMTVNGRSRDISIDRSGKLLEVEDEVAFDALPASVRDGLTQAAGTAKIGKIESLTKNGRLVAYETVVTRAGKRHEIQVGPDGGKLAHPE